MRYFHYWFAGMLIAWTPAVISAAPFNGGFAGIQAGAVRRSDSVTIVGTTLRGHATDPGFGLFAGYDKRIGSLVIGGQAEIGTGADSFRQRDPAGDFNDDDPKWNYSLTARAGAVVAPALLLYGRLGYAAERVKTVYGGPGILVLTPPPRPHWRQGVLYGGGGELAIGRRVTIRAEYRRADYAHRYAANQALAGVALRF